MKIIQKFVLSLCLAFAAISGVQAAGGNAIAWDKAPGKTNDLASLQNGAKLFVNYCLTVTLLPSCDTTACKTLASPTNRSKTISCSPLTKWATP